MTLITHRHACLKIRRKKSVSNTESCIYNLNFHKCWSIEFLSTSKFHRVDEIQIPVHIAKSNGSNAAKDLSKPQLEESKWGNYVRGALYALQKRGNHLKQVRKLPFVALFYGFGFYIWEYNKRTKVHTHTHTDISNT